MPFAKGNKMGVGRPKVSLTKPELLLPIIFHNGTINWAMDFCKLYRTLRSRDFTDIEKRHWAALLDLMPYLCTKVQLKEIQDRMPLNPKQSSVNAAQTMELLKALENESNPQTNGD